MDLMAFEVLMILTKESKKEQKSILVYCLNCISGEERFMRLLSLCILHIALVVTGELYIYDMIISCLELACQDMYSIKVFLFF